MYLLSENSYFCKQILTFNIMVQELFSPDIYNWVILPLIIAFARILDVTVGTIRVIFVARGLKHLSPILGFV